MVAMNKQQARKYYSKKEPGRTTSYGARPGEITRGMQPGARWYDPDTNTWQLKDGAAMPGGVGSYVDELLNKERADVGAQDRGAGRGREGTEGSSGTGTQGQGGGGKAGEGGGGGSEGGGGQNANGDWVIPAAIAALGAAGIAAWLARKRGNKTSTSSRGPAHPATDTAGEADKGGRGGRDVVAPEPRPYAERPRIGRDVPRLARPDVAYGAYPDIEPDVAQEPPRYRGQHSPEYQAYLDAQERAATAGPVVEPGTPRTSADVGTVTEPGTPQITDASARETLPPLDTIQSIRDAGMSLGQDPVLPQRAPVELPAPSPTDLSISQTAPDIVDPELRRVFESVVQDRLGSGPYDPTELTDPSKFPDLPMMDEYMKKQWDQFTQNELNTRLRRIRPIP
jgi:hypothetical protein